MEKMFDSSQYQLLDFGNGRRLERFGPVVLDRPCSAAPPRVLDTRVRPGMPLFGPRLTPGLNGWMPSTAGGFCAAARPSAGPSPVARRAGFLVRRAEAGPTPGNRMVFELKRTDFGHVGLFPEQAENWDWIAEQVGRGRSAETGPMKVLILFAYTGGASCRCGSRRR